MRSISPLPWRTLPTALAAAASLLWLAGPASADNLSDAQRLIRQGQFPQAMEKVDAHLAKQPNDAQGRFLRGVILSETGRATEAMTVYSRLSEDFPELPEPYNNLAVLYAQQQQYEKARSALEMAIRAHPAYAVAYENLGDVYVKLAGEAYQKSLQLDATSKTAKSKLAITNDLLARPAATRQGTP